MITNGRDSSEDRLSSLEDSLCYSFSDKALLNLALTHPSRSTGKASQSADNQRLEFLGDAVLQLVLTEELFRKFEKEAEGILTKWRARLVSKPALAGYARQLALGDRMLMGKGEDASGGRERDSTLSDCMEAVFGALYLDGGYLEASKVILRLASVGLEEVVATPESGNPKGLLQEILQAITSDSPDYSILAEEGPPHSKRFVAEVSWKGRQLGKGTGESKKAAETAAAVHALSAKVWERSKK